MVSSWGRGRFVLCQDASSPPLPSSRPLFSLYSVIFNVLYTDGFAYESTIPFHLPVRFLLAASRTSPGFPPSKHSLGTILSIATQTMNRSVGRNVHIYDPNNPTEPLGGLVLCNGITNANFYAMMEVFVVIDKLRGISSHFSLAITILSP